MSEEHFHTIREYFDGFFDNPNARIINFTAIEKWAATKQKQARMKILLPREICDANLKDLDKWFLTIVAIPREDIQDYKEEMKK